MASTPKNEDSAVQEAFERRRGHLSEAPIIAAAANPGALEAAWQSPVGAIYLLMGTPVSLPAIFEETHRRGKLCLVNLDFLEGLARDRYAVEYLAKHGADGIVSTKSEVLRTVGSFGMLSILRTFAIDSAAVAVTLKSLSQFVPDVIEILPAIVAPKVITRIRPQFPGMHIIGGGLIETVREIETLFSAGVGSVTTSDARLWII